MSRLKIYNSKTRKKERIRPHNGKVGIYVCGVTPYNTTHLGHAFTYITYDILIRYLRFLGKKVVYVQNVTDVDDPLFMAAKRQRTTWNKLAEGEMKSFLKDMDSLNWIRPDYLVWASDHIKEMVAIIKTLAEEGFAYVKNGNVYFAVKKDKEFGQRLYNLDYEAMLELANERGNYPLDPNKRNPLDFVLWQKSKKGEPSWPSPWGRGRPGWHIECSAMSTKYLGQPFSLHGGGSDLRFPHHEAEISQSKATQGKPLADIFMHTAIVYYGGNKMSKSLGNMVFIKDLLKKYSANTIRWYLLSHHWRKDWEYNKKQLKHSADKTQQLEVLLKGSKPKPKQKHLSRFFKLLNNDLDTPNALEELFNLSKKYDARKYWREIFGFRS